MWSVEENVKAMIPRLTDEIAASIKAQAARNLEHTVASAIQTAVAEHLKDVIIPAVKAELVAQEMVLRASVVAAASGVGELMAAALLDTAKKKLSGYEGEKLLEKVFGPLLRGY